MTLIIILLFIIALAHIEDALFVAAAILALCCRAIFSYVGLFVGTLIFTAAAQGHL